MIRWLEGSKARACHGRATEYAADTPLGRATVKPFVYRHKGVIAWRGRLADGTEIERASARDCMTQLEAMIALQLERKQRRAEADRDRDDDPRGQDPTPVE